jgi:hypothetical protein
MTITLDGRPLGLANAKATNFYLYMSISSAAVAFLGFAPTYWAPMMTGTLKVPPVIHLHGAVFFSWTLFVALQTWLAASGRIAWHRTAGMLGVSLATAMAILGVLAAIRSMESAAAIGYVDAGKSFAIVPLASIVFFAVTFILAVANIRRPEWHKRLMLVATISILDAPAARWFLTFMAPPDAVGPPPVAVDILPALVAAMLLAIAILFDWRTRGRPHPAYLAGGAAYLAVKAVQIPVSETPVWHAVAGWILALAG